MSAKTDCEHLVKIPCKVWNLDRTLKKSIVVSSLEDLISKGKAKLRIGTTETVRVVLEPDGTEVDEEEYFMCLDPNTTFILLCGKECWKSGTSLVEKDEPDFVDQVDQAVTNNVAQENMADQLMSIVETVRGNPAKVIALSSEEMEVLVNADQQQLANMLEVSSRDAGRMQLNCQRYLDDRTQAIDAITLLKTCNQASKRQRTS